MGLFTPEPEKSRHLKDPDAGPPRRDNGRSVLVISAIAAVVAVGAFMMRPNIAPVDVWIEATARESDGYVTIGGETNLADGAILEIWIVHDEVEDGSEADTDSAPDVEAVVQGGFFEVAIEASDADSRRVRLVFDPVRVAGPQEGDVLTVYGLFGEALDGPHVVDTDRGKRVEYMTCIR